MSESFSTKRQREGREIEDEDACKISSAHDNSGSEDEVMYMGSNVQGIEKRVTTSMSCENNKSGETSSDNEAYEYSDGDEDDYTSLDERVESEAVPPVLSQTSTIEGSAGGDMNKVSENAHPVQTRRYTSSAHVECEARPRARHDVDELNAFMSSPEARSAFHDSTCAVALVGASTAQQSSLSDRKSPPVSAASSDTAVPPPRPATEAVAARFEYGGVRAGSWFGKAVWIALDPARFLLDWERAIAWGLDPNLDLVARLEFDDLYLDAHLAPKITQVRQAPPGCDLNCFELAGTQACGLEWVIQDRLNTYFREPGGWPQSMLGRTVINEVAECAVASVELAVEALRRSSGDKCNALELLLDPTKREHLDTFLAAEAEVGLTLPPWFHDPRGTFARKPMLREAAVNLRVFFPHALGEVLLTTVETFADESGKCDLERAASTLGDKLDLKSASQPSDLASPWDDASVWRAKEATMAHSNFIMRIVHFIEDKVRSVNSRCLVCDRALPLAGFKPSVCNAPLCAFRHEEFGLGLELAAEVLRNPSLLDLLVSFLYTAVHGGRVGLMYPSSVQRAQADGTVRSFVISDIMNDNGSSPSSTNGTVTGSSATSSTADASMNSPVSNNEFPAERMNLTLLKEVLDKMPSIACLQAWARGEEASCEADTNSVEPHLGSAYPLDAETINGGSTSNTYKSVRDNIEHNRVDSLNSPSEERASDRCMRERSGTLLRRKLDELDDLLHPLLRWLLRTNKAHLRPLRADERFSGLDTPFQFVLLSGPVEREQKFQALKKAHGSLFSWHGSHSGNWHVILRTSLKNMSDTKYMSAGASYGNGIYFSDHLQMSLGYCGIGRRRLAGGGGGGDEASVETHWPKSAFGSKLTCLALCEIIDKKDDFTAYPGTESGPSSSSARLNNEGIYVVPREDLVTTRFFIVNPKAASGSAQELLRGAMSAGKLSFLNS